MKLDETERRTRALRRSTAMRMAFAGLAILAVGALFFAAAIVGRRGGRTVDERMLFIGGACLFIGGVVVGMAVVMVRRIARGLPVETDERGDPLIPPARVVSSRREDEPASKE